MVLAERFDDLSGFCDCPFGGAGRITEAEGVADFDVSGSFVTGPFSVRGAVLTGGTDCDDGGVEVVVF